jgi:hypothetical protein
LRGTFGGAAVELFKLIPHSFECKALLIDLPAQSAALRGRIIEDREESRAFAPDTARLRDKPIYFELLAIDHFFRAANLLGARRVGIAAIEAG